MKTKSIAKKAASLFMSLLLCTACSDIVYSADDTASHDTSALGTSASNTSVSGASLGSSVSSNSVSATDISDISDTDISAKAEASGNADDNTSDEQLKELLSVSDILSEEDRTVLKSPSGSYILSLCDVWRHTMSNPYGFSVRSYGGNCSINAVQSLEYAPYSVLEGDSALYVVCKSYKEASSFEIDYAVKNTIDLSEAKYFTAGLFIADTDAESELSFTVTLTITASKNSFTETKEINSGAWYSLFFDISNVRGLSDVHYISISIKRFGSSDSPLICAADCLGASSSENALFAAHYLSEGFFSSENSAVSQKDELLTISANGENPYIQTSDPVSIELDGGNALRIRLGGNDKSGKALSFKTATLLYTTITSQEFSETLSIRSDIISDGVINYCTFPIPESVITGFRIYIDGTYDSDITILSIDTCPGFGQTKLIGSVSECLISQDGQSINIKGSLTEEASELYKGARLYLYTLEPYDEPSDISIRSVAAADTELVGSEFSFILSASGNTDLFFKKYLVMIYYQGALIQVASPVYITNPSAIVAEATTSIKVQNGFKGSSVDQGAFPVSGQKYTAVQVRLEKLVSQDPSQLSHVYGGRSFYFDSDYVSYLDSICKECIINEQTAFFVLTVSKGSSGTSKFLTHPQSGDLPEGAENEYCALNTETADGILYIRAICDFLASRYAKGGTYPCVSGFVLGSNIQNAALNYSMGSVSLTEFAETVSDALHIIYNAVSLRSPGTDVYLSLGCDWNNDISKDAKYVFDSRSVIDAVSAAVKQSGDLDFKIAYDPYPESSITGFDIETISDIMSQTFDAQKISFANLELLVSYLSQSTFRFEGEQREVILLEKLLKSSDSNDTGSDDANAADTGTSDTRDTRDTKGTSDNSNTSNISNTSSNSNTSNNSNTSGTNDTKSTSYDSSETLSNENTLSTYAEGGKTDTENPQELKEALLKQASADYILSYCKLTCTAGISAFIVSHDVSYIETYSLIDTDHFEEISKYVLNMYDISDISELVDGFEISKMSRRQVSAADISSSAPATIKGTAALFSFEESSDGFSNGSYCGKLSSGNSPSGKSGVLSVQFENAGADRYMSVINKLDYKLELSDISCLKFEVQPTSLPSSVSEVKLTVVLSFGEDAVYASGYIKAGVWNTVYIDLSSFPWFSNCDSIKLLLSSESELGEPSLLIDTFYAMSDSHSDQSLSSLIEGMKRSKNDSNRKSVSSDTIKLLFLLILSAATLEVLNIMIKHRSHDSKDDDT